MRHEEMIMMIDPEDVFTGLTPAERMEVELYVAIFREHDFRDHWQVNEWISANGRWGVFPNIRSFNDHVLAKGVRGIRPRFFARVCNVLGLREFDGSPLLTSTPY